MDESAITIDAAFPLSLYINTSVVISDNTAFKNRLNVFANGSCSTDEFLSALYAASGVKYPRFYKMDRLSKLGWLAAEILLGDSFRERQYKSDSIGIVLANSNSSLDTDIRYFETVKDIPSPALFVYTLPNIMIGEISIRHQFKGENAFFIAGRFDTHFIEQYVSGLLNNNILQACICGWVELLGDEYKAALFLVEKIRGKEGLLFTAEHMNQIYQ